MQITRSQKNPFTCLLIFTLCGLMGLVSGCASGGFKLTRDYARWVNSQHVILRVILYILTSVVFVVTILIDVIVNNTADFWNGTVSQGTYKFTEDGKNYVAVHEFMPGTKLKRSTIRVTNSKNRLLQEVVLKELASGEIELYVDGYLKSRVHGISETPIAAIFDRAGKRLEERILPLNKSVAASEASRI